jgi:hypothetical protein
LKIITGAAAGCPGRLLPWCSWCISCRGSVTRLLPL